MQVFCLTYAGGTASFYDTIEKACDKNIEFIKFEYPGHGIKNKEKLCYSIDEVVEKFYLELKEKNNGEPYAILGYSMGSLIAIYALQYIYLKNEKQLPNHIFICAHCPHIIVKLNEINENNIDDYVKKRTVEFDAIPNKLLNNNIFWRMYLPIYKADYTMINTFDIESFKFKTSVPATVFYGKNDIASQNISDWNKFFDKEIEYIGYNSGHFFIKEYYKDMAMVIQERLYCIN